MKGIILAGGSGTRLYPITISTIKQLLPIYDKPMIYYPLATLMLAGIRDILIISTKRDLPCFIELFGDGSNLGLNFYYKVQDEPKGIAEALIIGEEFIDNKSSWLVLGDNIFFGHNLVDMLSKACIKKEGATVFGYNVSDPERYGVVEFNTDGQVISIEEKPEKPKSNYAVTGLYYYDKNAPTIAKSLKPSHRGELEITALNNEYLKQGLLTVELMRRGYTWLDTGTYDSLLDAATFVSIMEHRQGLKIACIEEIAYNLGYIDKEKIQELAYPLRKNSYGKYLLKIIGE
ncbi:MAG: glucose-1-phosphate thymidylyltransferase RfbA [Candidatus Sericytochromatia bacterium]|nr:glucose-1-phosphate thymidylyltransferase RfbA [Candidatus Sericytochromatia bacterium]